MARKSKWLVEVDRAVPLVFSFLLGGGLTYAMFGWYKHEVTTGDVFSGLGSLLGVTGAIFGARFIEHMKAVDAETRDKALVSDALDEVMTCIAVAHERVHANYMGERDWADALIAAEILSDELGAASLTLQVTSVAGRYTDPQLSKMYIRTMAKVDRFAGNLKLLIARGLQSRAYHTAQPLMLPDREEDRMFVMHLLVELSSMHEHARPTIEELIGELRDGNA